MDARDFDDDGLTVCPVCGKHYEPELGGRDPEVAIQLQFPEAKPYQREQLVSGICSDECWSEMFGGCL